MNININYNNKVYELIIDDEDYEKIKNFKLIIEDKVRQIYCLACIDGKKTRIHRYLLDLEDPKIIVDHINHNGLDNRKQNLRLCNNTENARNSRKPFSCDNGLPKGVEALKNGKYIAYIKYERKKLNLGVFDNPTLAGKAYDQAARHFFKEFASPNFPLENDEIINIEDIVYKYETKRKDRTRSKYVGIYLHKFSGLWHACIAVNKKKISIKYCKTEELAAQAYDDYVVANKLDKPLNFKTEKEIVNNGL